MKPSAPATGNNATAPTQNRPSCEALWNDKRLGALLILLITLIVYLPALRGGFIWDDQSLVVHNPEIQASDGLHRLWLTTESPDYYPVTGSLWWLEWRLWGDSPMGYHLVNVLFHAANAILLWMILCRLKIPGAWLAGLVFAVHPVNVATVAWISEQKNTLSMLFYAAATLLYLRFDEDGRWRWYVLSLGAFLLALLSKTALVTLPLVLLGLVWWLRGKIRLRDYLLSVPFFVLSLVLGLVTVWFQSSRVMLGQTIQPGSFLSHLVAAGCVPWFYLYKALLPYRLCAIYPKWNIDVSSLASWLPGIILVAGLALFWCKRKTWGRPVFLAAAYFVVTLAPVMGFIHQTFHRYSLVADQWQYYSIIAIIALVVGAAMVMRRRTGKWAQPLGVVLSVLVLMVLGVATWTRAAVYADSVSLWRDTLAKNPDAWVAHGNLGAALMKDGRIQEALAQYEQALQANPNYAEAHYNLGLALMQLGNVNEAITQYEQALQADPDDAETHYNLGVALVQSGRIDEGMLQYKQALQVNPNYTEAHINLGAALLQSGKINEAIVQFEQALQANPGFAQADYDLGVALTQAGRFQEAITHLQEALRLKPDYPEAQAALEKARGQAGDNENQKRP
jgi:protein O-mannosyl-transferase